MKDVSWLVPVVILSALVQAAAPVSAAAQTSDAERTALARSLFGEGVELADEGRFEEAVDRFRRVYELKPTAGVAYNLAAALAHLDEAVEASELLREAVEDPEAAPDIRRSARELLGEVEGRIARLTIELEGATEGVAVHLDGHRVEPVALGVAAPVDPGEHVVEARREARVVVQETVELADGETRELSLDVAPAPEQATETSPEREPEPLADASDDASTSKDEGSVATSWWLWTGVGVLVAGAVALGLVLGGTFDGPEPVGGNTMPEVITWR